MFTSTIHDICKQKQQLAGQDTKSKINVQPQGIPETAARVRDPDKWGKAAASAQTVR